MATTASPMCLRCLRRALGPIESPSSSSSPAAQRAAFSTTPSHSANPPKKKGVVAAPTSRQGRTLRLNKNKRVSNTRPPAVGERKALRKRVILSNSNALEVAGLKDLTAADAGTERLRSHQGQVLGLSDETVDALRALEAFKPTQGWNFFRRPASLIREETLSLAADLEKGQSGGTVQKVLFGERGSGKSVLQLQTLALAHLKKWAVIHIPEAKDVANAHTSYQPVTGPNGTTYIQPHFTAKLLENVNKANQSLFSELLVSQEHSLPVPLPPNATLAQLAAIGARNPAVAWPIWQALWAELLSPSIPDTKGMKRPPVLFAVDGVDHIMRHSAYLDASAKPIHAHDLALVEHFVSLLSSPKSLPNGGLVLAATSESNRSSMPTLERALVTKLETFDEKKEQRWEPYVTYDTRVQSALERASAQQVQGISKDEARGIMEYYARSGMMRNTVTEGLVSEKWTLAGGGIVGQIERGSVLTRF